MHPILARAERLAAYLAAWLVVALLLGVVLTRQEVTWVAALALLLPICLIYAFVCLSAWYVCWATPLTTSGVLRVLGSSAMAAIVASGRWIGLARRGCRRSPPSHPSDRRWSNTAVTSRCCSQQAFCSTSSQSRFITCSSHSNSPARPSGASCSSRSSRATPSCGHCGHSSIRISCTTASTPSAR